MARSAAAACLASSARCRAALASAALADAASASASAALQASAPSAVCQTQRGGGGGRCQIQTGQAVYDHGGSTEGHTASQQALPVRRAQAAPPARVLSSLGLLGGRVRPVCGGLGAGLRVLQQAQQLLLLLLRSPGGWWFGAMTSSRRTGSCSTRCDQPWQMLHGALAWHSILHEASGCSQHAGVPPPPPHTPAPAAAQRAAHLQLSQPLLQPLLVGQQRVVVSPVALTGWAAHVRAMRCQWCCAREHTCAMGHATARMPAPALGAHSCASPACFSSWSTSTVASSCFTAFRRSVSNFVKAARAACGGRPRLVNPPLTGVCSQHKPGCSPSPPVPTSLCVLRSSMTLLSCVAACSSSATCKKHSDRPADNARAAAAGTTQP